MADVAKLKKKAAELELKKQFDKALAVYVEILEKYEGSDEEVEVGLYNRVGDILLRQGNVADAVDYYEKAVDHYVDTGFYNNAIALCNKILRSSPGRSSIYYKLGKISAHKGFKSDAKANYLEYADRMQKSGKTNEAFRALKEFADLCPDQEDIRLMLAEQLTRQNRNGEAVEQLQLLYERYLDEGREAEAQATVARMKLIDPMAEPKAPGAGARRTTGELVFLDLNDSAPSKRKHPTPDKAPKGVEPVPAPTSPASAPPPRTATPPRSVTPPSAIETLGAPETSEKEASRAMEQGSPIANLGSIDPAVLDGMSQLDESEVAEKDAGHARLDGLQSSAFAEQSGPSLVNSGSILDLEQSTEDAPDFDKLEAQSSKDDLDASEGEPFDTSTLTPSRGASPAVSNDGLLDLELAPDADESSQSNPVTSDFQVEASASFGELLDDSSTSERAESGGSDLELIMPDELPAQTESETSSEPSPDIPLMDLELPPARPARAARADAPMELEMLDLDAPPDDVRSSAPLNAADVASHPSTTQAAHSVELLQAMAEADRDDHGIRRRLGEAMLDAGDRESGLRELEAAMIGYERADELDAAAALADEIVRLNPASVRHHQKRVEYAFRLDERGRLIEAYLALADALFRAGHLEKSRAIYQRVLDLAPEDVRAQAAMEAFPESTPEAPIVPATPTSQRQDTKAKPATTPRPSAGGDDEFVNLGDWLRGETGEKNTRMVVPEQEPSGDENADFQDMLRKFKQGIAENVEEEDHQSHYDLGVAYKEMGLVDEAIAEFQKALRAPTDRVPTYEALGQCFIEKEQYTMASTILSRALTEKGVSDDRLIGVLYLLGRCAEERGQPDLALEYYQRVFVVDIQFRDVGDRLAAVEGAES